jgi:hypothetical protein
VRKRNQPRTRGGKRPNAQNPPSAARLPPFLPKIHLISARIRLGSSDAFPPPLSARPPVRAKPTFLSLDDCTGERRHGRRQVRHAGRRVPHPGEPVAERRRRGPGARRPGRRPQASRRDQPVQVSSQLLCYLVLMDLFSR